MAHRRKGRSVGQGSTMGYWSLGGDLARIKDAEFKGRIAFSTVRQVGCNGVVI